MSEEKEEAFSFDEQCEMLTLIAEGQELQVLRHAAQLSKLIHTSLELDPATKLLELKTVGAQELLLVLQYLEHHNGIEPPIISSPLRSKAMSDVCADSWDAAFIDSVGEKLQLLYKLISAANYLDIKSLLHLGCAKTASLIKGKSLKEIADILEVNGSVAEEKSESMAD